jgi:NAD(P)-dependent dehydrogenase (short-subunit alcohol dehydrogenase family)
MSSHSPRIAVVTGAGSGIGAAVAHALAGDGWVVVLAGRRHEALASVAERGAELRGMLDPAPTDVTGEASVRALFDRTLQRHGRERGQGGRHQGGDRALIWNGLSRPRFAWWMAWFAAADRSRWSA